MSSPNGGVPGFISRFFQRPGVLGAALVAGTLVLAAALAYQAVRAAASHRAAVETALEHHATTAAWRFAPEARSWLGYGMNAAGDMLQHEIERRAELPGPDIFKRVLAQKDCDCMTAAFGRTFLRLVIQRDAPLDVKGEPLSERSRDALRATMQALATDPLMRPGNQWRMLPPGWPRLNRGTDAALIWRVNDKARRPRAIYGMVVQRAQLERPLAGALAAVQFFPSAVVPASVASTLVRMEVAGRLRGGCHHNWDIHCTVWWRYGITPDAHDGCLGFRLVLS